MTLEDYTKKAKEKIREYLKAEPRKELEKYIMTLERRGYIKSGYEQDIDPETAEITGCEAKPKPEAFAYGIMMLYPDLPPKWDK